MDKVEIKLTKNMKCTVDKEDLEKVSKHSWYAHEAESGRFYAATRGKKNSDIGLNKFIYLHRYIIDVKNNKIVDHIDGNTLNNCKDNLRITNLSGNSINSNKQKRPLSSKYKGVHFMKRDQVWVAQIKNKHIGRFKTEKDAAIAYNKKAKEIYGDLAKLNDIK